MPLLTCDFDVFKNSDAELNNGNIIDDLHYFYCITYEYDIFYCEVHNKDFSTLK